MADSKVTDPAPATSSVQAMLKWIGSNPLGKPADMVKRLSHDSTVAVNALSTLARDGLVAASVLESYVETDEEVGPRVSLFELNEKQLSAIGREFTAMRDAASGMQAANLQLATLDGMDESRARTLACVRVLAESHRSSAQVSQQLATHYDRFVSVVLNPLQGAAAVVQENPNPNPIPNPNPNPDPNPNPHPNPNPNPNPDPNPNPNPNPNPKQEKYASYCTTVVESG